MIISKAPHRISFSGGGTDYPKFYQHNGATVIGCAIDKYVTVVIAIPFGKVDSLYRLSYSDSENVDNVEEIKHPIIRAALIEEKISYPIHVTSIADVPSSTGLGTSSAFTVALMAAINKLKGREVSKAYLAEQAIYIERDVAGLAGGRQDQWWAALGGLRALEFNETEVYSETLSDNSLKNYIEKNSYLVPMNETRSSNNASLKLIDQIDNGEHTNLIKIKDLSARLKSKLQCGETTLKTKVNHLSETLESTWSQKKKSIQLSSSLQDFEVLALEFGIPMKLCGGGYSGFVYVLANSDQVKKLTAHGHSLIPINIDNSGVELIHG